MGTRAGFWRSHYIVIVYNRHPNPHFFIWGTRTVHQATFPESPRKNSGHRQNAEARKVSQINGLAKILRSMSLQNTVHQYCCYLLILTNSYYLLRHITHWSLPGVPQHFCGRVAKDQVVQSNHGKERSHHRSTCTHKACSHQQRGLLRTCVYLFSHRDQYGLPLYLTLRCSPWYVCIQTHDLQRWRRIDCMSVFLYPSAGFRPEH